MRQAIENKEVIAVPLLKNTRTHSRHAAIVGWYIATKDLTQEFTLLKDHPEALYKADALIDLTTCSKVYVTSYNALIYNNITDSVFVDANLLTYLNRGVMQDGESTDLHYFYKRRLNINDTAPLVDLIKLQEYARVQAHSLVLDNCDCFDFYQTQAIPFFHKIELNGLAINDSLFRDVFGSNGLVQNNYAYTKYNLYTSTGRPSNRFAGVNFAALSKEDNTRECFVSRYEDGVLLELDFQSYHPRLLSDLIRYNIEPTENIYHHLAKFYFNTDTPTTDQISKAKEATFWQLYGGIRKEFKHIEYFQRIQILTDKLWEIYNQQGYVQSLISKRKITNIEEATPAKLLNYFIQLHETEQNIQTLSAVFNKLPEDILPVLYTYDSIVFDLPKQQVDKLKQLLSEIIPAKYPFKIKFGDNYKHMT